MNRFTGNLQYDVARGSCDSGELFWRVGACGAQLEKVKNSSAIMITEIGHTTIDPFRGTQA